MVIRNNTGYHTCDGQTRVITLDHRPAIVAPLQYAPHPKMLALLSITRSTGGVKLRSPLYKTELDRAVSDKTAISSKSEPFEIIRDLQISVER